MRKITLLSVVLTSLLGFSPLSAAQTTGQTTPPAATPTAPAATPALTTPPPSSTLRDLQREARQLELRSGLQPDDRAAFDRLVTDRAALARDLRALRERELTSYVQALRAGASPAEARARAEGSVAQDRADLARRAATLRESARTLAQKYPRLANLFADRAGRGRPTLRSEDRRVVVPAPRSFRLVPDPRGGDRRFREGPRAVPRDRLGLPRR
jgi:hypothetical protein